MKWKLSFLFLLHLNLLCRTLSGNWSLFITHLNNWKIGNFVIYLLCSWLGLEARTCNARVFLCACLILSIDKIESFKIESSGPERGQELRFSACMLPTQVQFLVPLKFIEHHPEHRARSNLWALLNMIQDPVPSPQAFSLEFKSHMTLLIGWF